MANEQTRHELHWPYGIADEIIPNLYICDLYTVTGVIEPMYTLSPDRPSIKYILSLLGSDEDEQSLEAEYLQDTKPVEIAQGIQRDLVFRWIDINDQDDEDMLREFDHGVGFIEASLANGDGGVLVHCLGGVSRSPTMVIAYLMKSRHISFQEAFEITRSKHRFTDPNNGFVEQLKLWKILKYSTLDSEGKEKLAFVEWKNKKSQGQSRSCLAVSDTEEGVHLSKHNAPDMATTQSEKNKRLVEQRAHRVTISDTEERHTESQSPAESP